MRLNCARNSGVDYLSRPEGCDLTAEGLEPYHEHCMSCGCIISLTSSPWVPFLMCFCVLLPSGRLGPSRAEVGLGFALFRLVQALLSSPSSAGLGPCPSAFRSFPFPLPFQGFARFGLGVSCWCLLFPSSLAFPSSRPG